MPSHTFSILSAIADPKVFGRHFTAESWKPWLAFLAVLFGLPMTPDQAAVFRKCTGRTDTPTDPFNEAWLICGRRSGKSFVLATVAVFLACFRDFRPFLQAGERGTVMIVAADRKQARTIFRYVVGLLEATPMLAALIQRKTLDSIDLSNGITIEIHTASYKTTRGYTIVAALLDEIAFWDAEDSANPDGEVINAVRAGMATIDGAVMMVASSPFAKAGELHQAFKRYHAENGAPVLVWRAPTWIMNPTLPRTGPFLTRAFERDPSRAAAEYCAEFRENEEAYVTRTSLDDVTDRSVRSRPPNLSLRYAAFTDMAGGSGKDSATLAIAHMEGNRAVLDVVLERRPRFDPEAVAAEFAETTKTFGINEVTGDAWAGEWPRRAFAANGVHYRVFYLSKSAIYAALIPAINSQRVLLLDDDRLLSQLSGLQRRVTAGGRETIDHGPRAHDDVANAAAGALVAVLRGTRRPFVVAPPRLLDLSGEAIDDA